MDVWSHEERSEQKCRGSVKDVSVAKKITEWYGHVRSEEQHLLRKVDAPVPGKRRGGRQKVN